MNKKIDFNILPKIDREPRYSVQVSSIYRVSPEVFVITLERPPHFTFRAGQYVWLVLPDRSEQKGIIDRRAYSIASAENDSHIELLVRLTKSDFSQAIQKLKQGDTVSIIGPMGSTFCVEEVGAVLISGGTGIAPFLSIIQSNIKKAPLTLVGFYTPERPLYKKDILEKVAQSGESDISFFSDTPSIDRLRFILELKTKQPIYISGPQVFVNKIYHILVTLGVQRSQMFFEACYPEDEQMVNLKKMFHVQDFEKEIDPGVQKTPLGHIFFQIAYQTSNHVIFTDRNGIVLYANDAAQEITGYSLPEMLGQTPRLWGGLMSREHYQNTLWKNVQLGQVCKQTILNRRRNGSLYVALATLSPIREAGSVIGYVATEEDITEIEALDKTKSEFIALASHQLKTPPTAIKWLTERLLGGKMGKFTQEQKEYIDDIKVSNQRVITLVNALLNISKIEMGIFSLQTKEVNPCLSVQDTIQELQPLIKKKKLICETVFPKKEVKIDMDENLFRIVISNFISNAISYTPENGTIGVFCHVIHAGFVCGGKAITEDSFVVAVSDTGYGIPIAAQEKIFTKLFRADNIKEKNTTGTGLGLYIVKSIIDHAGGMVWFVSHENKGSTFYVSIPMSGMKEKIS